MADRERKTINHAQNVTICYFFTLHESFVRRLSNLVGLHWDISCLKASIFTQQSFEATKFTNKIDRFESFKFCHWLFCKIYLPNIECIPSTTFKISTFLSLMLNSKSQVYEFNWISTFACKPCYIFPTFTKLMRICQSKNLAFFSPWNIIIYSSFVVKTRHGNEMKMLW